MSAFQGAVPMSPQGRNCGSGLPDALIALACAGVVCDLAYVVLKRERGGFERVLAGGMVLALALGVSHGLEACGAVPWLFTAKMVTALVGFITVANCLVTTPRVLRAPSQDASRDLGRMEGQLKASEDRFRLLVEGVQDYAIFLLDPEGRITSWNLGAERLTGYTAQEILGRPLSVFFEPGAMPPERLEAFLRKVAEEGRCVDEGWRVRKDGSRFLAYGIFTASYDAAGAVRGFAKVTRDITAQREDEAARERLAKSLEDKVAAQVHELLEADRALFQSQKLESLGVLAGGIAHDFNNLLGAMQGNVELALAEESLDLARPHLETLQGLMAKGSDLLKQMLVYAGRGSPALTTLDLNRLVEEMAQLLKTSISKKAAICKELHPGPLPMEGDPSQIQQVLMNLVINASEALDERNGVITLRTGLEELSHEVLARTYEGQGMQPGLYVAMEVADNGAGMPPDVLKKIFDPFFTTKFTGRGLGLAALHGIVRSHRGGLRVHSKVGAGSTFKLLFPAARAAARAFQPEPPRPAAVPGAGGSQGTVLVVDDVEAMRAVTVKALVRMGLPVLEARDGQEALAVFEAHRHEIRLILMDFTMPTMDGEEACRELRRRGCAAPVILTSGFDEADALSRFEDLGLAGFLQKPFALAALVEKVGRALSGQA